jgi:hypothetical protein
MITRISVMERVLADRRSRNADKIFPGEIRTQGFIATADLKLRGVLIIECADYWS